MEEPHLLVALVLGVVEGLTEFLPVSSTGHLILAGHALGFTGARADTFEVAIQSGAMGAVLGLYARRLRDLAFPDPSQAPGGLRGRRGLLMLALTSAPALLLGFLAHKAIKAVLFNPRSVAAALIVGAVAMVIVERLRIPPRADDLDTISPRQALAIGVAQCLALWPGMSRSASTIMGGMLAGVSRKAAAEYSFLAALPIIGAATAYDLLKAIRAGVLAEGDIPLFTVGFLAAWASAHLAVKVFIRVVGQRTLVPFAVYRVVVAAVVLAFPQAF